MSRQFDDSVTARTMALIKAEWRAEWEAELLGQDAIERVGAWLDEFADETDAHLLDERDVLVDAESVIRAALGAKS